MADGGYILTLASLLVLLLRRYGQVNASPSLTTSTESDRIMKNCLLRDIYHVVAPEVPPTLPE